jgi:PAS domain S-box-containing protein
LLLREARLLSGRVGRRAGQSVRTGSLSKIPEWWADRPLWTKGLIAVFIPSVALLVGFVAVFFAGGAEDEAQAMVDHTLQVRSEIRNVLTGLLEAEASVRGFAITHQPEFVENLDETQSRIMRSVGRLAKLVSDNQRQSVRVHALQPLIDQKFDFMRRIVTASPVARESAAEHAPLLVQSNAAMKNIRKHIEETDKEEERTQWIRAAKLEEMHRIVLAISALTVVFGFLGGVAAVLLFSSGIVRRVQKIQENARRLAQELPLLPIGGGRDEIGLMGRRLEEASQLLAQNRQALEAETQRLNSNICEREKIANALRESEHRLQAVLDNTTAIVCMKDTESRFQLVNRQFEKVFKRTAQEVRGKDLHAVFPSELADLFRANDLKVIRARVPLQFEEPAMHDDGLHTYLSTKFPLLDSEGNAQAVCTISTDITDRKQFENELERAREEADRANHAKSEFLSRMSHELRTPLNAILGFAQILELEATSSDDQESVDQILRAGRHLLALINEVLDISRIESGRLTISTEPVEVGDVVRDCIQLVRVVSEQRHVQLKINSSEVSEKYVLADRQRLKQVVLNLVSNAVKYNREGGKVLIGCEAGDDETLRLKIQDTGFGISPHDVERLFSPFERLQPDTAIEGSGLGLALSKRLIELMGGRIGVKSVPNEGSLFWIELPQTEAPLQRLTRDGGMAALDLEAKADTASKSLLYIEDNLPNLRLIERIFEKRPRIRLLAAMQGEIGLNLARQHRPDLVLLDINLPDIPGAEVLRRLRGENITRHIPIVVVSADATPRQINHLLAAGASDYLIKPIEVKRFLGVVEKLLDQPESSVTAN